MKIRSFSPLLDGSIVEAKLTMEHPSSSYEPVLVLDNGEALRPEDVLLADYRIVSATPSELKRLLDAGYDLPTLALDA
jgi:hypothetical protein